jgi:hypothetical protein
MPLYIYICPCIYIYAPVSHREEGYLHRAGIFGADVEAVFLGPMFSLGCIPDVIRRQIPGRCA